MAITGVQLAQSVGCVFGAKECFLIRCSFDANAFLSTGKFFQQILVEFDNFVVVGRG